MHILPKLQDARLHLKGFKLSPQRQDSPQRCAVNRDVDGQVAPGRIASSQLWEASALLQTDAFHRVVRIDSEAFGSLSK